MKSRLTWTGARTFLGQTESGHSIAIGTAHEDTLKPGPSAMELMLMSAGSCSAWDVVSILEKGRQPVDDVIVEMEGDRSEDIPKVFTRIHLHFVVKGRDIDHNKVSRAIELSIGKYCSAVAMIEKTATVTHSFEVTDP